ncbi:MAG: zinc ABC transporter ATP-binding protein ZnuC [Arenicellales bacterium WSBS_2016_MAG_OTU3]
MNGEQIRPSSLTLLLLNKVSKTFGADKVLSSVDLDINSSEIVTLIGPNGSGKTTLIKIALGLLPPDSGSIEMKKGLTVGYVPQYADIDATLPLSVKRFLLLSGKTGTTPDSILNALTEVGVAQLMDAAMQRISGGERRRVLLARALLREPDLLVLDEPTAGVDVAGQGAMYELIREVRDRRGCGVLLVSHDLHLVMAATDKVICLNRHVCCAGHPEDITRHPEYLNLFGDELARNLAFYSHHHNHEHDLHGEIVKGS